MPWIWAAVKHLFFVGPYFLSIPYCCIVLAGWELRGSILMHCENVKNQGPDKSLFFPKCRNVNKESFGKNSYFCWILMFERKSGFWTPVDNKIGHFWKLRFYRWKSRFFGKLKIRKKLAFLPKDCSQIFRYFGKNVYFRSPSPHTPTNHYLLWRLFKIRQNPPNISMRWCTRMPV